MTSRGWELVRLWPAWLVLLALPVLGRERVGDIEFFGYKGIDLEAVRKAIPVQVGEPFAGEQTKDEVRRAVTQALGSGPTDVEAICCNEDGDRVIFVGLPGSSSKSFPKNPEPRGTARLSNEIVILNDRLDQALRAAVQKGGDAPREDDSAGYALVHDPAARALQLQLREYALAHENELLRVLESCSDARQRRIAASAVGYQSKSSQQVAALVKASRDTDEGVRDEAIRALGVLGGSDTTMTAQIPSESFIEMLSSATWTDRNKASFLLQALTRERNPLLLAELHTRALDSLMEMAKWRDLGHAVPARILLGRIAGIPEERLLQLAWGPLDPILAALQLHDAAPR
jgi:hypothetical protein